MQIMDPSPQAAQHNAHTNPHGTLGQDIYVFNNTPNISSERRSRMVAGFLKLLSNPIRLFPHQAISIIKAYIEA